MQPVNRRRFLTGLGAAAGLIATLEPVRRLWADLSRKPYSPPKIESVSDYNPPGFEHAEHFTLTDPATGEFRYDGPSEFRAGVAATFTVNGKTLEFPTIQKAIDAAPAGVDFDSPMIRIAPGHHDETLTFPVGRWFMGA